MPGYEVLQYQHSYLRPRTDLPGRRSPDGEAGIMSGEVLSYLRAQPELAAVAYSPPLRGAYVRDASRWGPSTSTRGPRRAALRRVATETGATPNQVVLAWLIGGDVPMIPLIGASSVAQLDESLAAVDLELTPRTTRGAGWRALSTCLASGPTRPTQAPRRAPPGTRASSASRIQDQRRYQPRTWPGRAALGQPMGQSAAATGVSRRSDPASPAPGPH